MKINSLLFALALTASAAQAQQPGSQFPVAKFTAVDKDKKPFVLKPGPQQATLAAKGAFPFIKATDPSLKTALPATNFAAATKLIGKPTVVVGVVVDVYTPISGSVVLLNFAKNYKTAVVGAIKAKDYTKFPVLLTLKGKKVALKGKMIDFKKRPEIELSAPGSISIVK